MSTLVAGFLIACTLAGAGGVAGGVTAAAQEGASPQVTWSVSTGSKVPTPISVSPIRGHVPSFREQGQAILLAFVNFEKATSRHAIAQLDKLQVEHGKALKVIAISEQGPDDTRAFVESTEWSGRISFAVAADPGRNAFQSYFGPRGVPTLPVVFVIRDGVVQWSGDPVEMAEPVEGVVRGTWDLAVARRAAQQRDLWNQMIERIETLAASKKFDEALAMLDTACESAIGNQKGQCQGARFSIQVRAGRIQDAIATGEKIIAAPSNPKQAAGIAWTLMTMAPNDRAGLAFAVRAAQASDTALRSKDPMVGAILARAQFANGQVSQAIETARRAAGQAADSPELLKALQTDLEAYNAAQKSGSSSGTAAPAQPSTR